MQLNPFISGNPVSQPHFINRKKEIRRVVGRILNHGQSSAIVGEPRSGKTSLLQYLSAPENAKALYGEEKNKLIFSFVDSLALGRQFSPAEFWEYVLEPVEKAMGKGITPLRNAYLTCVAENCGNFVLERLFGQLFLSGRRLILLIDEFDAFLDNDIFHQSEFYGGLRALASRSKGLVLVIASRQSLSDLNHGTQEFNRTGSPYFNFLDEIPLRPFSKKATEKLLDLNGDLFTRQDRDFIIRLAGGHPYFLQTAAFELWETYQDEELESPEERHALTQENFYIRTEGTLSDTWRLWTPATKKALGIIALDEMPALLDAKQFHIPNLLKKLPAYAPELKTLKQRGFIKEDPKLESGYCVTAEVMISFIADKLLSALREGDELTSWLQLEEWDGIFTKGEKKQLLKAGQTLGKLIKEGVELFTALK